MAGEAPRCEWAWKYYWCNAVISHGNTTLATCFLHKLWVGKNITESYEDDVFIAPNRRGELFLIRSLYALYIPPLSVWVPSLLYIVFNCLVCPFRYIISIVHFSLSLCTEDIMINKGEIMCYDRLTLDC